MRATLRRPEPEEVEDDLEEGTKPKGRRVRYFSIGIVITMLLVALVFFLLPSPSGQQTFTGPVVALPAQGGEVVAGPCNFPLPVGGEITIAPADVTWSLAGSMASPSSASAGPATPGLIPACYERSPQGALLAAANWITTMTNPKVDKIAAVTALVGHTGGYDQFIANYEAVETAAGDDPVGQQIAAFRMLFFDLSHAEIEIVNRATSGSSPGFMASVVYVMVWENDDWKVAPVLDGNVPITKVVDAIAPPYIPFNGV
jgi:hypothetical protein